MANDDMDIEQDISLCMPEVPGKRMVLVDADELAALRQWQKATLPIVRAMADTHVVYREQPEEWYCPHCGEWTNTAWGNWSHEDEQHRADRVLRHDVDCPVRQAQALLESEASDAE